VKPVFAFADELGPAKVIHVHNPAVGLEGVLVVDNVATGPSIGGLRMAPDVSTEECARLARAMTLKNAAAGLPHGGGKSVIWGDPKMSRGEKERLVRAFACALRGVDDYIFGPDMGTDETCMAWVRDEIGRSVGLPREVGGIPLDEIGATGWGIRHAAEVAVRYCDFALKGARVAVQGFGAVGQHAARFLAAEGAVLVAAADSGGTLVAAGGLDIEALARLKAAGESVCAHPQGDKRPREAVIEVECDIWIPAARPDVIHEGNVERLRSKLILEGANIPITPQAEQRLHDKGILCVPDFIANAGGVICAATEYRGAGETEALAIIEDKLRDNTAAVLERAARDAKPPRAAAMALAVERVQSAMQLRRWSLYR
jgi:glutamate dehydrogenase (NAD(P)+)